MDSQKIINVLPGVILALVFCLFSQGINNLIGIEMFGTTKSPISTVMIAILLGIIMGNAFTPRPGMMIGLDFTQKYILKLGIIFLGIRLSFEEFLKFGTVAIPVSYTHLRAHETRIHLVCRLLLVFTRDK